MVEVLDRCIYCTDFFNPNLGEGDHVLASAVFGEFKDDVPFRGCCPKCNSLFGRYEQQLAQSGPEGFFRNVVKPKRHRRKAASMEQRGGFGAPAPMMTANVDGFNLLVKQSTENPRDAAPVDQLLIVNENGHEFHIRLFPGMTAQRLQSDIAQMNVGKPKCYLVNCDLNNTEFFKSLIASVFPHNAISDEWTSDPADHGRVPMRIEFQTTTASLQAIAKIAFHYYLSRNRRGKRGDETEFAEIRDFILNGGEARRFFRPSRTQFVDPFPHSPVGAATVPSSWCHVFVADESGDVITARLRLFVGPEHLPEPISVILGRLSTPIRVSNGVWGHVYKYNSDIGGRFSGRVEPVSVCRRVRCSHAAGG